MLLLYIYDYILLFLYVYIFYFQKVIARMNRKAFLIAKEIVETEETFIQVLRMLNEVLIKFLITTII